MKAVVVVELRVAPGAFHGFEHIGSSELGDRAATEYVNALKDALNR